MKNVLIIISVMLITVGVGFGVFYFLVISKQDDSEVKQIETSDTKNVSSQDGTDYPEESDEEVTYSDEEEADDECPEGVICLGGTSIPTIPTITLGTNEVYAAELEDDSGDTQITDQEDDDTEDNVSATEEYRDPTVVDGNTQQNVMVTNKDYRTWSIIWVTDESNTGYVKYGTSETQVNTTAYDDRESNTSNLQERFTHHVTITNTDTELRQDDLVYYFKIISGGEEFDNDGDLYEYLNVPLTTSPSIPSSVSVTSNLVDGYSNNDYIVVARQESTEGSISFSVSGVYTSSGGIELIVGTARSSNLNSYFTYSSSNSLEARIYAPNGYTGYVNNINLNSLENDVLNIELSRTGYSGDVFTTTGGSNYSLDDDSSLVGESDSLEDNENLPQTGIEDSWAFTTVFGLVVFFLGIGCVIIFIPWNYKNIWEKKIVNKVDYEDEFEI